MIVGVRNGLHAPGLNGNSFALREMDSEGVPFDDMSGEISASGGRLRFPVCDLSKLLRMPLTKRLLRDYTGLREATGLRGKSEWDVDTDAAADDLSDESHDESDGSQDEVTQTVVSRCRSHRCVADWNMFYASFSHVQRSLSEATA